jgi:galactokinase
MPAAIEPSVFVEATSRSGRMVSARIDGPGRATSFSLDRLLPPRRNPVWVDYVKGVCWALERAGYVLRGANLEIKSTIPVGAGLSSSAALELGAAAALVNLAGLTIRPAEMAMLCRSAENEFVGVRCGIMDQFAVALGRAGRALLLDCRSLAYEYIPLVLERYRLLIVDSRVSRSLAASAYNRRREECEAAVQQLAVQLGRPLRSLRDLSLEEITGAQSYLPDLLFKRSLYVVEENGRVIKAAAALRGGDLHTFGRLMGLSHAGLRDLYQVSCPLLDLIVDTAAACPGVLGARMTGAGFGGCAVVLLEAKAVELTGEKIREAFARQGWPEPRFYLTAAAPGVTVEI